MAATLCPVCEKLFYDCNEGHGIVKVQPCAKCASKIEKGLIIPVEHPIGAGRKIITYEDIHGRLN